MAITNFVTVAELEHQLSLFPNQETASYLSGLGLAASDVVSRYVQGNVRPESAPGDPEADPYPVIKQAVLMLAAEWYLNREANTEGIDKGAQGHGFLPQAIQSILYPLRNPVVI